MEARGVSARPAVLPGRERLVTLAPWALGLALVAHLVTVAVWPRALTALLDLEVYRASGRAVLSGVAKLLFTGVNLVALGLVIRLCLLAMGYRPGRTLAAVVLLLTGLLFWLEPVRSTIGIGQVNLLLMLLLVWDLTRPDGARSRAWASA